MRMSWFAEHGGMTPTKRRSLPAGDRCATRPAFAEMYRAFRRTRSRGRTAAARRGLRAPTATKSQMMSENGACGYRPRHGCSRRVRGWWQIRAFERATRVRCARCDAAAALQTSDCLMKRSVRPIPRGLSFGMVASGTLAHRQYRHRAWGRRQQELWISNGQPVFVQAGAERGGHRSSRRGESGGERRDIGPGSALDSCWPWSDALKSSGRQTDLPLLGYGLSRSARAVVLAAARSAFSGIIAGGAALPRCGHRSERLTHCTLGSSDG